jgi:tetratricopeptide (TPR) repeat protein
MTGRDDSALEELARLTSGELNSHAPAHRELGVILAKRYARALRKKQADGLATGVETLEHALSLDTRDFSCQLALGNALSSRGDLRDALAAFRQATELSNGHPDALLSEVRLRLIVGVQDPIDDAVKQQLENALRWTLTQAQNRPPAGIPRSSFVAAALAFFLGEDKRALQAARAGAKAVADLADLEEPLSYWSSLRGVPALGTRRRVIDSVVALLQSRENALPPARSHVV